MIYKRHLLTFGPTFGFGDENEEIKRTQESMAMGEGEQWEAIPKDLLSPKTWWRKWMKMN